MIISKAPPNQGCVQRNEINTNYYYLPTVSGRHCLQRFLMTKHTVQRPHVINQHLQIKSTQMENEFPFVSFAF